MKIIRIVIVLAFLGAVAGIASCGDGPNLDKLCRVIMAESDEARYNRHLAIYMNVRACLTCCESMEAWQELEKRLPDCDCGFSFWAPMEDSVDVAIAMELEGFATPVHALSRDLLTEVDLDKVRTPFKVLFAGDCELEAVLWPAGGKTDSRRVVDSLLQEICGSE